jgi:pyruvate,water dikinase
LFYKSGYGFARLWLYSDRILAENDIMITDKNTARIIWFKDLGIGDVPLVGGKNAALGEMFVNLVPLGIRIPDGFAITSEAYRQFLREAGLNDGIKQAIAELKKGDVRSLRVCGAKIRKMILAARLPADLEQEILAAYRELANDKKVSVAVRSSATAEDLPGASFAGQQETYLNISGEKELLLAVKKCIASLFTDRAISYRVDQGFADTVIALSVGVQRMVRSDLGASGVAFTLDTETGFDKVVIINGTLGLGELIVQGKVNPDEWQIFKPTLAEGKPALIVRNLGNKDKKIIYGKSGIKLVKTSARERENFALDNNEVLELARWCVKIEEHFSAKHKRYQPMDIEWAKDGATGELFIVQARPETIHSAADKNVLKEYRLKGKGKELAHGAAIGTKIASGTVRVIRSVKGINSFKKGEVLVTEITDPDWEPIMKIAAAIVTDKGGRTSHAAIVSRELGIPCIVGTEKATRVLKNGAPVTIDCSSGTKGLVLAGVLPFEILEDRLDKIPETRTKIMVNVGTPDEAYKLHNLPVKGVGLGRLEFIIMSHIGIHPNALLDFGKIKIQNKKLAQEIERRTPGYKDKTQFYVDELAEGIAKIAATFYPHDVIIRFSDFKTNEYRTLLGGELYEPYEENPMIGWRGASRYYDSKFERAFGLECAAFKKVREEFGLTNAIPMIPFCRTVEEGKEVVATMAKYGLDRMKDKTLKIYMMCEIPSNVILADEFLDVFDGLSIGSNDLTQLTLGLDRDAGTLAHIGNENNEAVKKLIAEVVGKCRARNKYIGICGQAPSDYPDFAKMLVELGIESISLNPDVVIKTLLIVAEAEKRDTR